MPCLDWAFEARFGGVWAVSVIFTRFTGRFGLLRVTFWGAPWSGLVVALGLPVVEVVAEPVQASSYLAGWLGDARVAGMYRGY